MGIPEKLTKSKAGIGLVAIAIVAIVLIAGAAAVVWYVMSDDDGDDRLSFDDPLIQGTMGIGTEFEYTSDEGNLTLEIVAQSGSYYLVGETGMYFMMHKTSGDILFAENKGAGTEAGSTKWEITSRDYSAKWGDERFDLKGSFMLESGIKDGEPAISKIVMTTYEYDPEEDPVESTDTTTYTLSSVNKTESVAYEKSEEIGDYYKCELSGFEKGTDGPEDSTGYMKMICVAENGTDKYYYSESYGESTGTSSGKSYIRYEKAFEINLRNMNDTPPGTKTAGEIDTMDGRKAVDIYTMALSETYSIINYVGTDNKIIYESVAVVYESPGDTTDENIAIKERYVLKDYVK